MQNIGHAPRMMAPIMAKCHHIGIRLRVCETFGLERMREKKLAAPD